jgi:hypothetical protein
VSKIIDVDVAKDGTVKIASRGFSGAECQRATAELERALGVVKSDVKTPEFVQQQKAKQ